ncbi:MAG: hypothetical protein HRT67_08945 [Flavobacteriaceae bacterium]|nr:hypothetical protein [Flavobacteriaceae bacterium]
MDELELLKKDWQKQDEYFTKKCSEDIYNMLQKKSSSIVKMLFYISIGELIFWSIINSIPLFSSQDYNNKMNAIYENVNILNWLTFISFGIIILFVYLLFKAHKSILVTDNAKKLMESILKTRKIIKYYVAYNLVFAFLCMVIGLFYTSQNDPKIAAKLEGSKDTELVVISAIAFITTAAFVTAIWLFYKLLYGILTKRLNNNYNELKKLEI